MSRLVASWRADQVKLGKILSKKMMKKVTDQVKLGKIWSILSKKMMKKVTDQVKMIILLKASSETRIIIATLRYGHLVLV